MPSGLTIIAIYVTKKTPSNPCNIQLNRKNKLTVATINSGMDLTPAFASPFSIVEISIEEKIEVITRLKMTNNLKSEVFRR